MDLHSGDSRTVSMLSPERAGARPRAKRATQHVPLPPQDRRRTRRGRRARSGALRSLVRGRTDDPAWVRPALFGVLAAAAVLCLWNLTVNGYSNEYGTAVDGVSVGSGTLYAVS